MKDVVAYCRVSTNKDDQVNSFEAQKAFFTEYAEKNNLNLIRIYADKGITGTSTKKRIEFNQMMQDSEREIFDTILVKDVSRLARNTVDLLDSVRKLKALNIEVIFITADMTTYSKDSELLLTMLGAVAQEESVNMSKRVKFGKQRNAIKGKVPNLCYGYIKTKGDYFNLKINNIEAEIVKEIFDLYVNQGYGSHKISKILNNRGLTSLRGVPWTVTSVSRILKNKIYAGYVINQKVEVKDIFTKKRQQKDREEWIEVENPNLRIIPLELWEQAQKVNENNNENPAIKQLRIRRSNKHLFSTLIVCSVCGYSFRRFEKKYKTHSKIWWGCSGRNHYGADYCCNTTKIIESELIEQLDNYFSGFKLNKANMIKMIENQIESSNDINKSNTALESERNTLVNRIEKYKQMFVAEIIKIDELERINNECKKRIKQIDLELNKTTNNDVKKCTVDYCNLISEQFSKFVSVEDMTNTELKRLINHIIVDENENVNINLNLNID